MKRCSEAASVCVPVEKYCDMKYDCPQGSDEINCDCQAWNMQSCQVEGNKLCIYSEWMKDAAGKLMDEGTSCIDELDRELGNLESHLDSTQCMEFVNRTAVGLMKTQNMKGELEMIQKQISVYGLVRDHLKLNKKLLFVFISNSLKVFTLDILHVQF